MLESLAKAFQIPELKRRIFFNLAMFAVFVLGVHIPVPGVDHDKLAAIFQQGGFLNLVDVFSGGALRKMTLFAMGITPYINASIIMQMLTLAVPKLEQLSKEGEAGRKQIARITRRLTIALATFQAIGFSFTFREAAAGASTFSQTVAIAQMVIMMVAGTMFLLWMGEQITERGIGNGVSVIIFAGIMASFPFQVGQVALQVREGLVSAFGIVMFLALFVGTIYLIVMITQAERRIPIQHVKKQVGMRQTGGSNFLPIKVNTAGVIPIIFAISMLLFPSQILAAIPGNDGFIADLKRWANYLTPSTQHWWSLLIYGLMIVGFTYFYTAVVMNVNDMADNLKKYGNFIPGIRPGRPTFEYLDRVVSRVTLAGAVFLAGVALIQYVAPGLTGVSLSSFALIGGTSLLIVVGVAIEVMQAIEAQLIMRNYEGFIKQSSKSPAGFYA